MRLFGRKEEPRVPEGADSMTLLALARNEEDPVRKHQLLLRARDLDKDNLKVQHALLMLGRLYERDVKRVDFSVIKCYILHVYEHPEQHGEEDIRQKTRELFDDAQLKTCLALAPHPESYLRDYLEELSLEYIRLFLAGDSSNVPSLFGITRKHSVARYLAKPMADIIENMLSSAYLRMQEQQLAAGMFYRACHRYLNGQTEDLDRQLSPEIIKALI